MAVSESGRRRAPAWEVTAIGVGAVVIIAALLGPAWIIGPDQIADAAKRIKAQNDLRLAFVQAVGVFVVVLGAWFSTRTLRLSREGHLTDRFKSATDLLAGSGISSAGGVLALERIAHDSQRDHPVIIELLALFIRASGTSHDDRQTALQALSRRNRKFDSVRFPVADVSGIDVRDGKLDGLNLSKLDLSGSTLEGVQFKDGRAIRTRFRRCSLRAANLTNAVMTGADFEGADLSYAVLERAKLSEAQMPGASLTVAIMNRAVLDGANLSNALLPGATLNDASLKGTILTSAEMQIVFALRTDATLADLSGCQLQGAALGEATLRSAKFDGADLTGAILTGADLTDARLRHASLRGADLTSATLTGADLEGADLTNADLRNARLVQAVLRGVDFTDAKLDNADFAGADLTGAVGIDPPSTP